MNYPIWQIPLLGGPWIVGLIASFHVFISHFAVGGGIFFAITEHLALKNNDSKLYDYLKSHSRFFMILTTVTGAVTGVAIWWVISLVSPDGTHTLIQNYTLGWATEYLFFVAEIATIFVYYYTWDKISKELHLTLARWYAVLSVFTLIIINGILTFMLTPGGWLETGYWGHGFFNPTYWPSLIIRLIIMMAIAGMYALFTSALLPKYTKEEQEFRGRMLRYASKWFIPMFLIGPIVAFWFFNNIPSEVTENIFTGIQSSGVGNFSILARVIYLSLILSGTILVYVFVGPFLNARGFSFVNAALFLVFGLFLTGIGEWSREMLRKPYVVYNYMYSNGLRKDQVDEINSKGFLATAKWTKFALAHANSKDNKEGEIMFKQQCMSCHTKTGYRSMIKLLGERDADAIEGFLKTIHHVDREKNPYANIMPPLLGKPDEIKALAKYLADLKK